MFNLWGSLTWRDKGKGNKIKCLKINIHDDEKKTNMIDSRLLSFLWLLKSGTGVRADLDPLEMDPRSKSASENGPSGPNPLADKDPRGYKSSSRFGPPVKHCATTVNLKRESDYLPSPPKWLFCFSVLPKNHFFWLIKYGKRLNSWLSCHTQKTNLLKNCHAWKQK